MGPEQRTDKKPMLSDLRESGSIEQDADMVVLLHRPDAFERDDPRGGEADLIIAKHRSGPTKTITVAHQLHLSRFTNMAKGQPAAGVGAMVSEVREVQKLSVIRCVGRRGGLLPPPSGRPSTAWWRDCSGSGHRASPRGPHQLRQPYGADRIEGRVLRLWRRSRLQ